MTIGQFSEMWTLKNLLDINKIEQLAINYWDTERIKLERDKIEKSSFRHISIPNHVFPHFHVLWKLRVFFDCSPHRIFMRASFRFSWFMCYEMFGLQQNLSQVTNHIVRVSNFTRLCLSTFYLPNTPIVVQESQLFVGSSKPGYEISELDPTNKKSTQK